MVNWTVVVFLVLVFVASLWVVDKPLVVGLAYLTGFATGGFIVTLAKQREKDES